jgi:hypothetical protein
MSDTEALLRRFADQVWRDHEPDDAGKCRLCKIYDCGPRRDAEVVLGSAQAGINVEAIVRRGHR